METNTAMKAQQKERLLLYNSLFGQQTNSTCESTGLQLAPSLNYSLHTFLHLSDVSWVLAMINIGEVDEMKQNFGHQNVNNKINQVGTVINNFCQNDARKLKGFVLIDHNSADDDNGVIFALLMYCHPSHFCTQCVKAYSNGYWSSNCIR